MSKLLRVCTFRKWMDIASSDYDFCGDDVQAITRRLVHSDVSEVYFHSRLFGSSRQSLRCRNKQNYSLIMTSMGNDLLLMRSARSKGGAVDFYVVADAASREHRDPAFSWRLQSHRASTEANQQHVQPCSVPLHFEHYRSLDKQVVMITGPCDVMDVAAGIPSTRLLLLARNSNVVRCFHLQLTLDQNGGRVWPLTTVFSPQQRHLCAMVCSSRAVQHLPRDSDNGILANYDVHKKIFTHVFRGENVSSAMVQYICDGRQLLGMNIEESGPSYRHVLLFNADDLDLLCRVPILPICSPHHVTILYSGSRKLIALLLKRKKPRKTMHTNKTLPIRDPFMACTTPSIPEEHPDLNEI